MDKLAILLKTENLVAHSFHNLVKGVSFVGDHKLFGQIYEELEEAFDSVVERDIGLGESDFDMGAILKAAGEAASRYDGTDMAADEMCAVLLGMERSIQAECEVVNKTATLGTQNLVAQLADDSERRVYKLRQRIK
jgi:DNA-binding ferritin-like protein